MYYTWFVAAGAARSLAGLFDVSTVIVSIDDVSTGVVCYTIQPLN